MKQNPIVLSTGVFLEQSEELLEYENIEHSYQYMTEREELHFDEKDEEDNSYSIEVRH